MVTVLASGFALAALLYPSAEWAIALLAVLLVCVLVGAHRISTSTGGKRAFAYGFTLGGLGHFIGVAGVWFPWMIRSGVPGRPPESAWIGHLLLSLLAGVLAGLAARLLAECGERGDAGGIRS